MFFDYQDARSSEIYAEDKISNYVVLAFWLLACSELVLATQVAVDGKWTRTQQLMPSMLMLGGFLLLARASRRWMKLSRVLSEMPRWIPVMWFLLLAWGGVTILRSFEFDFIQMYYLFGKPGNAAPWLIPIFMVLGSSVLMWEKLVSLFYVHALLGIAFFGYAYLVLGKVSFAHLLYGVPILLVLHPFFPQKKQVIHIALTASYLLLCLAVGSRTGAIMILYYVAIWYYTGLSAMRSGRKIIFGLLGSVVIVIILVFSFYLYKEADISFLPENLQTNIGEFQASEFKNTRTFMYGELWEDLDEDEALIGRGAMGGYYSRIYYGIHLKRDDISSNAGWRDAIECGYLHTLLKGGVIMILLMSALAVPAALLGIFRSQNLFIRLCGFYVFEWLVMMYPYGLPEVNFPYILFWMCIGACLSPSMRARNNTDFDFSPIRVFPRLGLRGNYPI